MITGVVVSLDPALLVLLMAGSALAGGLSSQSVRKLRSLVRRPVAEMSTDPLAGLFNSTTFAEALRSVEARQRGERWHGQRAMMAALRTVWPAERPEAAYEEYVIPAEDLVEICFLPPPQGSENSSQLRLKA